MGASPQPAHGVWWLSIGEGVNEAATESPAIVHRGSAQELQSAMAFVRLDTKKEVRMKENEQDHNEQS